MVWSIDLWANLTCVYCVGTVSPPESAVTYKQLKERGFRGTKYDAELMIAQGFTLQQNHQINTQPFLGKY